MLQRAKLVCINPKCGKTYPIRSLAIKCDSCHFLLDAKYEHKPNSNLKDMNSKFKRKDLSENLLTKRRSVRTYNKTKVPIEVLSKITAQSLSLRMFHLHMEID